MARRRRSKVPGSVLARLRALRKRFDKNRGVRHRSNRRGRRNSGAIAAVRSRLMALPATAKEMVKVGGPSALWVIGGVAANEALVRMANTGLSKVNVTVFNKGWAKMLLPGLTGTLAVIASRSIPMAKNRVKEITIGAIIHTINNAMAMYKAGELKIPGMKDWDDNLEINGLGADPETAYPWGVQGVDDYASASQVRAPVMADYASVGQIRAPLMADYASSANVPAARAIADFAVAEEIEELS